MGYQVLMSLLLTTIVMTFMTPRCATEQNTTCQKDSTGLPPFCDFEADLCNYIEGQFVRGDVSNKINDTSNSGFFFYHDTEENSQRTGDILSTDLKDDMTLTNATSVCVSFDYVMTFNTTTPYFLYVHVRSGETGKGEIWADSIIGHVSTNTDGQWKHAHLEGCVNGIENIMFGLEMESKPKAGIMAIDNIKFTHSNMSCGCEIANSSERNCTFNEGWCNATDGSELAISYQGSVERINSSGIVTRDAPALPDQPPGYFLKLNEKSELFIEIPWFNARQLCLSWSAAVNKDDEGYLEIKQKIVRFGQPFIYRLGGVSFPETSLNWTQFHRQYQVIPKQQNDTTSESYLIIKTFWGQWLLDNLKLAGRGDEIEYMTTTPTPSSTQIATSPTTPTTQLTAAPAPSKTQLTAAPTPSTTAPATTLTPSTTEITTAPTTSAPTKTATIYTSTPASMITPAPKECGSSLKSGAYAGITVGVCVLIGSICLLVGILIGGRVNRSVSPSSQS